MMTNISELFNNASNKLLDAMKLYIELISVKSSIKRLEIERNYSNQLFDTNNDDSFVHKLELSSKEFDAKSLELKKGMISTQIIQNVNSSIMSTIILLKNSIKDKNDYGVQMSIIMLENNIKFINENKQHISIPLHESLLEILNIGQLLQHSPYRNNIKLLDALLQLKNLI